jgi:Fe-S oxidoreductase
LGEISIEQEIYEQAITDISESVRIQEEQNEENRDERMLAESFYQLGLCQQFKDLFKEANETYQKSINIMQMRIEKLKGKIELIKEDSTQEAERITMTDEITELEALLPEMLCKLEEVNEQGEKSLSLIKEAKEIMMNIATTAESTTTCKATTTVCGEVKDITNMVKSKRKIDATEDGNSVGVKKTRLSENGDCEATENSEPMAAMDIINSEMAAKTEEKIEIVVSECEVKADTVTAAEPMMETAATPITA